MALAYAPPGVNVEELYSPSVSPLLSVSASICLVGQARGYEVGITTVVFGTDGSPRTLNAPAGTVFEQVDTNTMFESVVNVLDPTAGSAADGSYEQGTDFQATFPADGKTATITPVAATDFAANGGTIQVRYRFVADGYYDPIRLDSQSAVEARFGPAFDQSGIVTPLTAAASLAFENGAATLVILPLEGASGTPTDVEVANELTWETTLLKLRDIEDVNVVVPVIGQADPNVDDEVVRKIAFKVQDYARFMQTEGQYVISIFGEDSSSNNADASLDTLRSHAGQLRGRYGGDLAEQTVLVTPSRFTRVLPSNQSTSIQVGGQYVAAAIAGMLAARAISAPLTRKRVSGFSSVAFPGYDKASKNVDASEGLLVVEQKGTVVQVRHAVTLDNTDTARRELSVVRAKHHMITSLRATLDTQVIGDVPADGNAPLLVQTTVISVLESLRQRRELVDYTGVQARILTNDPTTVECRFSYRPAFPLNYVNVVFSLDLSAGEITTTTGIAV